MQPTAGLTPLTADSAFLHPGLFRFKTIDQHFLVPDFLGKDDIGAVGQLVGADAIHSVDPAAGFVDLRPRKERAKIGAVLGIVNADLAVFEVAAEEAVS